MWTLFDQPGKASTYSEYFDLIVILDCITATKWAADPQKLDIRPPFYVAYTVSHLKE